ncbi:MAG: phosphate regulon sensor histidine kinase PhoR [Burkholderiaceae bacterium]|jgi:two-component system phosphate regulon sensor histidine kinase PhoR|uniref:phosphate regulon sensor histidine kinase PhoR n=1 Tax=Polynucleobacter sp. MWH-Loch1C5 TaxID=2689108 RepID=UPI001C0E15C5|nr:phosphate regulon sensor histidine kinase PhoR [Polynucleobacter sp. MWH-Loch1C5]MBU3542953.1 phosphate regulon sensor histidine kinase PhoR [Polynucleobacter sp. MWH-Loch1C5]NBV00562.1 phosphate regulon sensor histidine kinase PhoR [Burkholderiaceae bacterium]
MLSFQARIVTIILITIVLGWIFSQLYGLVGGLLAALIFLTILLVHQLWHAQNFTKLLMTARYGDVPGALGIWGEIYYRLHKLVKGWRDQVLEVEKQHQRFIQAIQASPNGVIMLNEDDQIEWCNEVAEQHFGIQARRDAMQRITHILRKPAFVQYILRQNYRDPVRLTNMGLYEQYSLDVQIFPYGDKQKLVLSQDISQIEKTDAMRRDFVANVSHELKTPLTVMAGFLETVQELDLTAEERQKYLGLISAQTGRMKNLVDDLLTLAKLEGNPEPPISQTVRVSQLMQRLVMDAEGLSQGAHRIRSEILSNKDFLGDEAEIYSAFSNLVSNAIRYTPAGGEVTVIWKDADEGGVEFVVMDTGPGIAEEHIPRLTERFYRVDRSRSRETGGTGLGLAIVKHVATRHQGELRITSSLGIGSRFTIFIPAQRVVSE